MLPLRLALGPIAVVLGGCSGSVPAELRFDLAAADPASRAMVRTLQFYVHDIEWRDQQGHWRQFRLAPDRPGQNERVALIDLTSRSPQDGARIRGTVESGAAGYTAVRFTVGVPFDLNHANPLTAAAPLDRGELFWTWQSGYKFLRVDLAGEAGEWSFHLGSSGCSSASALRPPAAPCARPNRVRVELQGDPLNDVVRIDLATLFAAARTAGGVICTGDYAGTPVCTQAYASTGLNLQTGACQDSHCRAQRLWTLGPVD